MQFGRSLTLIFDAYGERALEASGCFDDALGNPASNDPVLRRMPRRRNGCAWYRLCQIQRCRACGGRACPRAHFKEDIIQAFYDGIKHKPETTFGNVKADVLADKDPSFRRSNFCSVIRASAWRR
jgi:hypothetical protein